jgi:hypothetical protein
MPRAPGPLQALRQARTEAGVGQGMGRAALDVLGERRGCVYLDGLVEGHIEHPPTGGLLGDQP